MRATTVISLALGASFTGIVALAQQKLPQPALPVRGPALQVQVGGGTSKSTPRVIYANTIQSGYFGTPGTGEEWIDHGTIAAAEDHNTVTEVELGYATYSPTAIDLRFRVYAGSTGFCGFRVSCAALFETSRATLIGTRKLSDPKRLCRLASEVSPVAGADVAVRHAMPVGSKNSNALRLTGLRLPHWRRPAVQRAS